MQYHTFATSQALAAAVPDNQKSVKEHPAPYLDRQQVFPRSACASVLPILHIFADIPTFQQDFALSARLSKMTSESIASCCPSPQSFAKQPFWARMYFGFHLHMPHCPPMSPSTHDPLHSCARFDIESPVFAVLDCCWFFPNYQ